MTHLFVPNTRASRASRLNQAFSLVETALALGVVSFALISLMGLLPCGLQTFRKAMDFTIQTQMTQTLMGNVRQASYANLTNMNGQAYYFDDNANLVTSSDTTGTYVAKISVANSLGMPAATTSYSNTGVALVTITFSRKQAAASTPPLGTVVTYVAAMTGNSSQ